MCNNKKKRIRFGKEIDSIVKKDYMIQGLINLLIFILTLIINQNRQLKRKNEQIIIIEIIDQVN